MNTHDHLYILWTNADALTAEKMVFMYAVNALKNRWWAKATIIVWGATAKLVGQDEQIQDQIRSVMQAGVAVSACKACADQLGVTETLEGLGIEVMYWGEPLTELLKNREMLLTV